MIQVRVQIEDPGSDPEPVGDIARLRTLAQHGDNFCEHLHTIHRDPEHPELMWATCDQDPPVELGRFDLGPSTSSDRSDDIRYFVRSTLADHARDTAAATVE